MLNICRICKKEYDANKEGTKTTCQTCREMHNARCKNYYEKNRDKIKESRKARYAENPEYFKEYERRNRKENRERYREVARIRYARDPEKILKKNREYYMKNKEVLLRKNREYKAKVRLMEKEKAARETYFRTYDKTNIIANREAIAKKKQETRERRRQKYLDKRYDEQLAEARCRFIEENGVDPMAW